MYGNLATTGDRRRLLWSSVGAGAREVSARFRGTTRGAGQWWCDGQGCDAMRSDAKLVIDMIMCSIGTRTGTVALLLPCCPAHLAMFPVRVPEKCGWSNHAGLCYLRTVDCGLTDLWRLQYTREILEGARVLRPEPRSLRSQEGLHAFGGSCVPWSDPWWGPCPCPPCPKSAKQNSSKDPCLPSSLSAVSINPCPWGKIAPPTPAHYIPTPSPPRSNWPRSLPHAGERELGAWDFRKARARQGRGGRPPTPERQENPGRSRDFLDPVDRLWVPCVHAQSQSCAIQSRLIPSYYSPSQPIQRIPHSQVPIRTPYSSTRSIPPPLIRLYGYPCLFSFSLPSTHPPLHFPYPPWPRGFATLRLGDSVWTFRVLLDRLPWSSLRPYVSIPPDPGPSVDGLKT